MCLSSVRRGLGRPLLLVHGWGSSSRVWTKFSALLARQFQTTACDVPGFGHSDPVGHITLERLSERLLRGIDGHFMILGWSLGGLMALEMARRAPGRVAGIVLVATNPCFIRRGDWPHALESEAFESFARETAAAPERVLKRFAALQACHGARSVEVVRELRSAALWRIPQAHVLLTTLGLLSQLDMREVLRSLDCPISLILGDKDALVPVTVQSALTALAPRLYCYVAADAGHAPFLSHPTEIATHVQEFLLCRKS